MLDQMLNAVLHSSAQVWLLVVVSSLLICWQLGVILACLLSRLSATADGVHRMAVGLALGGPPAIGLLSVFGVQHGRDLILVAFSQAGAVAKADLVARGFTNSISAWQVGCLALGLLALLSPVAVLLAGHRRPRPGPKALWTVVVGVTIAVGLVAISGLLRSYEYFMGFSAIAFADVESRAMLLARLVAELSPMFWPLAVAGAVLLGSGVLAARQVPLAGIRTKAPLAPSLAVLLLGGLAFLGTRGHARDAKAIQAGLLERLATPHAFLSETVGTAPAVIDNTRPLELAPVIEMDRDRVRLDHRLVEAQDLTRPVGEDLPGLPGLEQAIRTRLRDLAEFRSRALPGQVTLVADAQTPGPVLRAVLMACERAGVERVQLANHVVDRIPSAVLGKLRRVRHRALVLALADQAEGEWPTAELGSDDFLYKLIDRLNKTAKKGRVRLILPPVVASEPAAEAAPVEPVKGPPAASERVEAP